MAMDDDMQTFRTRIVTNGDKIRQMTDEELADVLEWQCACCVYHPYQCKTECSEGHLKWLKKEVSANDER